MTKGTLLSLCSNLIDPLLLSVPFIATAWVLFRKVLREVALPSWKSTVPECCFGLVVDLAKDLLTVGQNLKVPMRAVVPNPIKNEAQEHPVGFLTLLISSDGSTESGVAAAYAHQQYPFQSGARGTEADFSEVKVDVNLLCADIKLTDNKGNNGQVDGELLGKHIATELLKFIKDNALVKFHAVRLCSDSLTIEKYLRKTSIWSVKRIAYIQRSVDLDNSWHLPGTVTYACVDSCIRYQRTPSAAMNEQWFTGKGVLDKPIQLLPWTDRAEYAFPRIEDMPSQWLSSTARLWVPAVVVMIEVVNQEVMAVEEDPSLLEKIADKHHSIKKAVTIVLFMLRFNANFRSQPAVEHRATVLNKFIKDDYEKVIGKQALRSAKISHGLRIEDDKSNKMVFVS